MNLKKQEFRIEYSNTIVIIIFFYLGIVLEIILWGEIIVRIINFFFCLAIFLLKIVL